MTFLLSAGHIEYSQMRAGSLALSRALGGELYEYSYLDEPLKVLNALPQGNCLFQVNGDIAMSHSERGSWLEALAAWKKPIIIFAKPLTSGVFPGTVPSYVALCNQMSVPLLGIVQLGGVWDPIERRRDGLPWTGWIPKQNIKNIFTRNVDDDVYQTNIELLGVCIKRQLSILDI